MHGSDIGAGMLHLAVHMAMLAAVRGLLLDEGINLRLLLRGHLVPKITHALDEEGFALGECERQAIVERRGDGIAVVPPSFSVAAASEHHVARLDGQVRRGTGGMVHRTLDPQLGDSDPMSYLCRRQYTIDAIIN